MYTHTWYLCESTQQLKKEKQNKRKNKPMISQSVPNLQWYYYISLITVILQEGKNQTGTDLTMPVKREKQL